MTYIFLILLFLLPLGAQNVSWDQLRSRPLEYAVAHGAVGDGSTDDTTAINAAITALSTGGVLDGGGKQYKIGTLTLKSNMTLQNFRLFSRAAATQFESAVTIDGTNVAKTNITIRNVQVDGNRVNQTGMDSQPSEDGGRNCFRLIGTVSNILIDNVQGNYCATDGLEIFSYTTPGTDTATSLRFQNLVIRDSQFNYNRRHGISADSMNNVSFINVTAKGNGTDLSGTEGGQGARAPVVSGVQYGRGADIEGYGVGSGLNNISFINCVMTGNAIYGISFSDPAKGTDGNFVARKNIAIIGGEYDVGTIPNVGDLFSIKFTQQTVADYSVTPELYQDVVMQGVRSNSILLISTKNVTITAPHVTQYSTYDVWLATSYAQNTVYMGERTTASMSVFDDVGSAGTRSALYSLTAGTSGALAFFSSTGYQLQQDASALFWNNTDDKLGIGTNAPADRLHVLNTAMSNGSISTIARFAGGADGTLGPLLLLLGINPSATGSSRFVTIWAGDNSDGRLMKLNVNSSGVAFPVEIPGRFVLGPTAFASLPTTANSVTVCSDCTVTSGADNTCAGSGTGALAVRLNGVSRCFAAQN